MSSHKQNLKRKGMPRSDKTEASVDLEPSTVRRGGQPGLRASNKSAHPGRPDISSAEEDAETGERVRGPKKQRRTGEQVAAEKQAKADQVSKDAATNLQKKRKVAELEDGLAIRDKERHEHAARPTPGLITEKAVRPVADLVAHAQGEIAAIEKQVAETMPRRASTRSAGSGVGGLDTVDRSAPSGIQREDYVGDFDDGDRDDDKDYSPSKENNKRHSEDITDDERDSLSSGSEKAGAKIAPLVKSPVRPKPKSQKDAAFKAREEIQAERSMKEKSATWSRVGSCLPKAASIKGASPSLPAHVSSNRLAPSALSKISVASHPGSKKEKFNVRPSSVKPSNQDIQVHDAVDFSSQYGGINDADEAKENAPEVTVHRPSNTKSIATIVRGAPRIKLEAKERRLSKSKETYTNSNLPAGTLCKWKDILMPAWRKFAGTVRNPWDTSDVILLKELNTLWNMTFPNMKRTLTSESVEYKLAKQRWYEWRGHISSAAQAHVQHYMKKLGMSPEDASAHIEYLLDADTVPFIWKVATEDMDRRDFSGLFRSECVLRGLADHMSAIASVPKTYQINDVPRAALALAAAGAECALKFWTTGVNATAEWKREARAFSETNHGAATAEYMKSIDSLSERAWDKILLEVQTFVDEVPVKKQASSDDFDVLPTGRSCLYEADSESE